MCNRTVITSDTWTLMLLLNSPLSTNIVNSKYSCYSDSGMSTMGWQTQHQHAAQCTAHPAQTGQQSQMQPINQYGSNSWAIKSGQNGPMLNANYVTHNGTSMANYGPNDPYIGCSPVPIQKAYSTPAANPPATKTTGTGYVILLSFVLLCYVMLFYVMFSYKCNIKFNFKPLTIYN